MDSQNQEAGKLPAVIAGIENAEGGLTGAQIAIAYKAALSDFVGRKTTRGAIAEVSKLLAGALAARRQELSESLCLTSQLNNRYY